MRDLLSPTDLRRARPSVLSLVAGAIFASLVAVAIFVAAAAAAVIGLLVTVAAMVLRLAPRRRAAPDGEVLQGRQTAEGWVVEAAAPR